MMLVTTVFRAWLAVQHWRQLLDAQRQSMASSIMPHEPSRLPYNAMPQALVDEVVQEIADYSVGLARMQGNDTKTFKMLGSGTLVCRGGAYGILTAHHVLHRQSPPVLAGRAGADRLYLILTRYRSVEVELIGLEEVPLGEPMGAYDEFGPDLTLLRFSAPQKAAVGAISSFWSLDRDAAGILDAFAVDRACIIHTGFPELMHKPSITPDEVSVYAPFYGGRGGLLQQDIMQRDGWDYLSTPCDYRAFPNQLPKHNGMSGGGIWSVLLKRDESGELKAHRFALVGVNFWETDREGDVRLLRGHFVRSIYARAWLTA